MKFIDFIINQVLREPSIFLGLVVLLGMIFLRKTWKEALVSTIKTIVGVRILQVGAATLVAASKPMMDMIVKRFGLMGRVADPWTGVGEGLERLDANLAGQIGLIMISAWLLHLVYSRFSPLKVVYLTGHVAFTDTVVITWGVYSLTRWNDYRGILFAVLLLSVYWWLGPAMMRPFLKRITGDDPLTLGHNMVFSGLLTMLISRFSGDVSQDAQKIEFPGWLAVFKDSVISYSVIMALIYTSIGLIVGPAVASTFSGAQNFILFSFMQGVNVAVGVTILLLGVRMFLAELIPAFAGFAAVVVPGAVAAVDNPAFWTYAPQAALLGLVITPIGMIVGIALQVLVGSPYITIPSVIPIFFGGCTLGVFANAYGGWRGTIVATFVMGIVEIFGASWFAWAVDFQVAAGGHSDFATLWPMFFTILKFGQQPSTMVFAVALASILVALTAIVFILSRRVEKLAVAS